MGRFEWKWQETLREIVSIIAAVLIALAGNAWWQSRTDHERERDYLAQLASDLTATRQTLDSAYIEENRSASGTAALLVALSSNGPVNPDSLHAWLSTATHYSDPRLVMGTINALQQTGDLRLIRDRRVRVGVSAYATGIAEDWAEFSRWIDLGLSASRPFSDRAIRVAAVSPFDPDYFARATLALRHDPETTISFRRLNNAAGNRRDYLGRMRNETDSLLATIRAAGNHQQ